MSSLAEHWYWIWRVRDVNVAGGSEEDFMHRHLRAAFPTTVLAATCAFMVSTYSFLAQPALAHTGLAFGALVDVLRNDDALRFGALRTVFFTWAPLVILLGFHRWSSTHYPWIFCVTLPIAYGLLTHELAQAPSFTANGMYSRLLLTFIWVTVFLRLPFKFASVLTLLGALPVFYIAATTWGMTPMMQLLWVLVVILLGLHINWSLENRERRIYVEQQEIRRSYAQYSDAQEAAKKALIERAKEAEAANEEKMRFLARASHDLRQPMTALGNFVVVARYKHDTGDIAGVKQLLDKMERAVITLSSTFNQILDISKYESGVHKPSIQPVDLRQLMAEVANELQPLAERKAIDFRLRLPKEGQCITISDADMLWRCFTNLVANAIKFTSPKEDKNSGVIFSLVRFSDRYRVDVWDSGCGISEEHITSIWEPFFQIGNRERNQERGLGLGLSIVRAACSALGHELYYYSVERCGSRFSIELPRAPDDVQISQPAAPVEYDDSVISGKYAIVLEDNTQVEESLVEVLKMWGMSFARGAEWPLGDDSTNGRQPDVIVTDFRLRDGQTGGEAISAIREKFQRCVPAVVITGDINAPLEVLAGVPSVKILHKPANPAHLRAALADFLSGLGVRSGELEPSLVQHG
jgi:signal transduction histidine kinase/CheY-like chemotaxis protein